MLDAVRLDQTIRRIVDGLVRGDYVSTAGLTTGRLTAEEIEEAISEYGCRLVPLPPKEVARSVIEIEGSEPARWSVYVDLWTAEEGRSDLTLELTLTDSVSGLYGIQIDNVHVL